MCLLKVFLVLLIIQIRIIKGNSFQGFLPDARVSDEFTPRRISYNMKAEDVSKCPFPFKQVGYLCLFGTCSVGTESWDKARSFCNELNADLVVMKRSCDHSDVTDYISHIDGSQTCNYWVGAQRTSRSWAWLDGTVIPDRSLIWAQNYPNTMASARNAHIGSGRKVELKNNIEKKSFSPLCQYPAAQYQASDYTMDSSISNADPTSGAHRAFPISYKEIQAGTDFDAIHNTHEHSQPRQNSGTNFDNNEAIPFTFNEFQPNHGHEDISSIYDPSHFKQDSENNFEDYEVIPVTHEQFLALQEAGLNYHISPVANVEEEEKPEVKIQEPLSTEDKQMEEEEDIEPMNSLLKKVLGAYRSYPNSDMKIDKLLQHHIRMTADNRMQNNRQRSYQSLRPRSLPDNIQLSDIPAYVGRLTRALSELKKRL